METIGTFPYFPMEFTRDGEPHLPFQSDNLSAFLANSAAGGAPVTDLLVISHGWNNNIEEARDLYDKVVGRMSDLRGTVPALAARNIAVLGVLWPSKRFTEQSLIPSGAAGLDDTEPSVQDLRDQISGFKAAFTGDGRSNPEALQALDHAAEAVASLTDDVDAGVARKRFVAALQDVVRSELHGTGLSGDGSAPAGDEERAHGFVNTDPELVFDRLQGISGEMTEGAGDAGGAAVMESPQDVGAMSDSTGSATGLRDLFDKARTAAEILLNLTTYYTMKERASVIGRHGVWPIVRRLQDGFPAMRIHLIGHSFGGRLVASVALGPDDGAPLKLASLSLLQAAFSHNGFSSDTPPVTGGFFRKVIEDRRVSGPIIVTHTDNDLAVGMAYPVASRIARDDASGLGDRNDPYGGIGRNGALHVETIEMELHAIDGGRYALQPGAIHNLLGSRYIHGHSDITGPEVAYAILNAVAAS